jgi:Phage late-transcription coactivator
MKKKKTMPKFEEMELFSKQILFLAEKEELIYIDAVTEHCEKIGLEVEVAATLITPFLVSKISEEARRNNLIEKSPVLPI